MAQYAVFGHPVAHSLSPQIQHLFAQQQGVQIDYQRILAPIDGFEQAIKNFIAEGGIGANVTVPFKTEAYQLATSCSVRAQDAHAVNTMLFRQGEWFGDNTDGLGLIEDITQLQQYPLQNKQVLILGAGGAALGVITPLLTCHVSGLTIANRTRERAQKLAQNFDIDWVDVNLLEAQYDVIINATSSSLHNMTLPIDSCVLGRAELVYDMMYGAELTPFLQQAQQAGCRDVSDGLGMLVAQAAASYELWQGFKPALKPVVTTIRRYLEQA